MGNSNQKNLIDGNVELNVIMFFQFDFLFIASAKGHLKVVKELLRNKENIEATDQYGYTPLIRGIFLNELLISNSFILFYFLFIASENGHLEVVKELLRSKANIEAIDKYGNTPLIFGIFLNELFISTSFI